MYIFLHFCLSFAYRFLLAVIKSLTRFTRIFLKKVLGKNKSKTRVSLLHTYLCTFFKPKTCECTFWVSNFLFLTFDKHKVGPNWNILKKTLKQFKQKLIYWGQANEKCIDLHSKVIICPSFICSLFLLPSKTTTFFHLKQSAFSSVCYICALNVRIRLFFTEFCDLDLVYFCAAHI